MRKNREMRIVLCPSCCERVRRAIIASLGGGGEFFPGEENASNEPCDLCDDDSC